MHDLRTRADAFEPLPVDRLIARTLQLADWTIKAHRVRCQYRSKVNPLFKDWAVLLTAATPVSAPVMGAEWLDINGTPSRRRGGKTWHVVRLGHLTVPALRMSKPLTYSVIDAH